MKNLLFVQRFRQHKNTYTVQICSFRHHPYTLEKGTYVANFLISTPEQTKHYRPVNPISKRYLLKNNRDDAFSYDKSLLKTSKTDNVKENYWFAIPQNQGNERNTRPLKHVVSMNYGSKKNLNIKICRKTKTPEPIFYPTSNGQTPL